MKFDTKIEKKEKGLVSISVKMDFGEVEKRKEKAMELLTSEVEVDGFRKGKAPKDVAVAKVGEASILQEAAQQTINEVFADILKKEKLQMIGYPAITVTKLAPDNDFEFGVEITVYPEVKLPEYKKIAGKVEKIKAEVKKEDIDKVLANVLEMQNKVGSHDHEHKEGEKCEHKSEEAKELSDDFIKKLGPFENVEAFKKQVGEDLQKDAEFKAISDYRGKIVEGILAKTDFEVPEILVNAEIDKIMAQMKDDMEKQGMSYVDYLKNSGKDEVSVREELRGDAESRAKTEVLLKEIAKVEKLSADTKEAEKQVANIIATYPNVESENVRLYVENILINEAVMKFLEK